MVVLTGSLPADVSGTFYDELLAHTAAQAVLDVRGPELLAALHHRPLVVKPNRAELGRTVGRALHNDRDLLAAMRDLNQAGAQWVVVTSGKDALWVSSTDEVYRLVPPTVDVAENPIGCGDALAAGLAVAIERGAEIIDAVRYGAAAAADRLRLLLPGRLDPAHVEQIAFRVEAQRL